MRQSISRLRMYRGQTGGTRWVSRLWIVRSFVFIAVLLATSSVSETRGDASTPEVMLERLGSPLPQSGWEPGVRNFLEIGRHHIADLDETLREHGTPDLFGAGPDFFALYYEKEQRAFIFNRGKETYPLADEKTLSGDRFSKWFRSTYQKRKVAQQREAAQRLLRVGETRKFDDLEIEVESMINTGAKTYKSDILFGRQEGAVPWVVGTGESYFQIGEKGYADTVGLHEQVNGSILVLKAKIRGMLAIGEGKSDITLYDEKNRRLKPLLGVKKEGFKVGKGKWIIGDYPFAMSAGTSEVVIRIRGTEPIHISLKK